MSRPANLKLILAMAGVAFFWGTTYLAIRTSVETIPPWFVTGIRQAIAALILLVVLLYRRQLKWIGRKELLHQFILSMLMVVLANGMTTVAEKTIPSGLTSLLNTLSPVMVYIISIVAGYDKPGYKGVLGLLLGFLGIAFIFRGGLEDIANPNYQQGIMAIMVAITAWSIGTVYTKRVHSQTGNIFLNLFYQFGFAAIVQMALAFIFSSSTQLSTWSMLSWLSVVYLAVFGSVITYFCYNYALKHVSPARVSILTYINTIIALFLGWLLLDEVITSDIFIAAALIIAGVFLLNYRSATKKAALEKIKP